MQVPELIDAAISAAGNATKLAQRLEIPFQYVSDWKHGRRTCTPEDQALLASVAGLDPKAVLIEGLLEKHDGTAKGDLLRKALGKARGAVVMLICGVSVAVACAAIGLSGGVPGRLFARR